MKFVTDKISMKQVSFDEFVKKVLAGDKTVKTASVKTAEQDEADSSGQPEAEAKLVNDPEKECKGKSGKADNSEAPSSGQPEAEAKLVNDPKKKCDKEAAGADNFGGKQAPPFGSEDKEDNDDDDKDDADKDDKDDDKDEKDDDKEEKKEASNRKLALLKVSALNAPTKAMLRTYWLTMYPSDYVDAMLAEK